MNICFACGGELKCQHMPRWFLSGYLLILGRVIMHGFDCVKVLFMEIVLGEELKDS